MSLEHLISCVGQDPKELIEKMHVECDCIVVNQKVAYGYEEFERGGKRVRIFGCEEQGVGLSRNTALERAADTDRDCLCLFGDEDIVYRKGYAAAIEKAFADHPDADILLFNVKVCEERRTYWTESFHRVHQYNCGRYPAYSIAARTERLHEKNLKYHLWFGGGARYSNGEDSLFLRDALKAGLKIYAVPEEIGEEIPRPSTWFEGYNDKFFYDRGVLYRHLYGCLAPVMAFRWLHKNRAVFCKDYPYEKAKAQMKLGRKNV